MSILANTVLFIHFLYVLGVVVPTLLIPIGWKRGWRWAHSITIRALHLSMLTFVLIEILTGIACPLTVLENQFLESAGKPSFQDDFISHWISKIMYWHMPYWGFVVMYASLFGVILLLWKLYPPRRNSA
jgi:hypothetical protein